MTAAVTHTGKAHAPRICGGTPCGRCGGLLVNAFSLDLSNSAGELEIETWRCVQCGDVVDPVILRNRLPRQDARAAKLRRSSAHQSGLQAEA
jgi:hypothetical protein